MVDSEPMNEEVDFPFPSEEGQAALSFRFLLHRCIDSLVYFPDARAVLKFRPGDEGRMGIVDFCAGCLKFGLPLVQSPAKISGPWPLSGCVNAMLLGRVSQPLWSWDIGRGSSFLSWHTKGIVVRVTRRDCPELLHSPLERTPPML